MKTEMRKILLIIPAYNEERNIKAVYESIRSYNSESGMKFDYVFINDGSTDGTERALLDCNANHVKLIQNLGIGGAVQTGYKYASERGYDIAVQMDGDGQHDIKCVAALIEPIVNGKADLVVGSRFIDENSSAFKSSFIRRIGIGIISAVMLAKTGRRIFDTTSGFRAANRDVIAEFARNYPTEYPEPISTTFLLKNGYAVDEVPVEMHERSGGVSSIRAWKTAYYMINVILSILLQKTGVSFRNTRGGVSE